jgi:hypothetical protein
VKLGDIHHLTIRFRLDSISLGSIERELIRWRSLRFAESIFGAMVLGLPPVGYANDCLRHATRTMLMIIDSLYREASLRDASRTPTITIVFVLDKTQTIHQHLLVLTRARSPGQ